MSLMQVREEEIWDMMGALDGRIWEQSVLSICMGLVPYFTLRSIGGCALDR